MCASYDSYDSYDTYNNTIVEEQDDESQDIIEIYDINEHTPQFDNDYYQEQMEEQHYQRMDEQGDEQL
jgi:hypothetical protein